LISQPIRRRLLATTILAGAITLAVSTPTLAQDAQASPEQDTAAGVDEVVVIGSRIRRQDYVASSPVVTVGQEALQDNGAVTVEKLLNELPQFVASITDTSNNPSNGGQANVELRGLGTTRTLVLINGRRAMPSNATGVVDLNTIPSALVENVEILTGGASAIYGSDAVAGVVNFRLRDDFEGVETDVQYGLTDKGDGETWSANLTVGGNFDNDRGNAVFSFGYANRAAVMAGDRDFSEASSGSGTIEEGKYVVSATNLPSQSAIDSVFAQYGVAAGTVVRGSNLGFNSDGSLFGYTSTGSTVNVDVADGSELDATTGNYNYAPANYLQLPLERFSGYSSFNYNLTDRIEAFGQFNFSHTSSSTELAPTPATGLTVSADNPFIPADLKTILNSRTNPDADFTFSRRFTEVGPRTSDVATNIFQGLAGIRGPLDSIDGSFELYASYGNLDTSETQTGNVSRSAVEELLDADDGGASLCDGGFNPFGYNTISADCASYISRTAKNQTSLEQQIVEGSVQGRLMALPAGDLRFAAGSIYRAETYKLIPDEILASGDVIGFNAQEALEGSIDSIELYGELAVPLLADMPFVRALNLDLGYRYSDYSTVGGVQSYKASLEYLPIDSVRFRGGYNRAVRAPNIDELYSLQNQGFPSIGTPSATSTAGDPCDIRSSYRQGENAAQVRALCIEQGIPETIIDTYTYTNTQVEGVSGGNPDLTEETADTYTIGFVWSPKFQSPWLEGLSGSIDWYSIEITDFISSVGASTSISRCFNANDANPTYSNSNTFCQNFTRDSSGVITDVQQTNANLGALKTSGVDLQVDYRAPVPTGALKFNLILSYLDSYQVQALPGDEFVEYAGTIDSGVGTAFAEIKSVMSATYTLGDYSLTTRWRYIGQMDDANGGSDQAEATNYFDFTGRWNVNETVSLRLGVQNAFDEAVETYSSPVQSGTDPSTYDVLGRRFTLGLTAKF
jgi:iron complex outermembrane receptor protein